MTKVAFDIGGTNMRVAVVTPDGIGEEKKIPTPQDPKEGIAQLVSLAKECAGEEVEQIAGGFPGTVIDGVVREAPHLPQWEGVQFADGLSAALGGVGAFIGNDADMAALGEATYGAGRGKKIVGYFGIGTGVGGGRIVDGRIDTGVYDLEPGHQIVDIKSKARLEALVSGRAFEKKFGVHPKDAPRSGYEEATQILAIGLHNTIVHWSPDVLILGGSMVFGVNGYTIPEITKAIQDLPSKLPMMPEIRMVALKDMAGLHGARAILAR